MVSDVSRKENIQAARRRRKRSDSPYERRKRKTFRVPALGGAHDCVSMDNGSFGLGGGMHSVKKFRGPAMSLCGLDNSYKSRTRNKPLFCSDRGHSEIPRMQSLDSSLMGRSNLFPAATFKSISTVNRALRKGGEYVRSTQPIFWHSPAILQPCRLLLNNKRP